MKTKLIATVASIGFTTLGVTGLALHKTTQIDSPAAMGPSAWRRATRMKALRAK